MPKIYFCKNIHISPQLVDTNKPVLLRCFDFFFIEICKKHEIFQFLNYLESYLFKVFVFCENKGFRTCNRKRFFKNRYTGWIYRAKKICLKRRTVSYRVFHNKNHEYYTYWMYNNYVLLPIPFMNFQQLLYNLYKYMNWF